MLFPSCVLAMLINIFSLANRLGIYTTSTSHMCTLHPGQQPEIIMLKGGISIMRAMEYASSPLQTAHVFGDQETGMEPVSVTQLIRRKKEHSGNVD